jgi:hypothetical protein
VAKYLKDGGQVMGNGIVFERKPPPETPVCNYWIADLPFPNFGTNAPCPVCYDETASAFTQRVPGTGLANEHTSHLGPCSSCHDKGWRLYNINDLKLDRWGLFWRICLMALLVIFGSLVFGSYL